MHCENGNQTAGCVAVDRQVMKKIIENSWSNLNDKQLEAVVNTQGPLLCIAGAGSGKTTVIIHKIAHLMIYGDAYMNNIDYDFVADRVAKLRMAKHVSAREMSLALGQNESYINKIENKQAFPSLPVLGYICEYLDVSPSEFFDEGNVLPGRLRELNTVLRKLTPAQIDIIMAMADEMAKKN